MKIEDVPFYNKKTKTLEFPLRPLHDLVFIYERPAPRKIGSIILPDDQQDFYRRAEAIVLAVGKGYYKQNGSYFPTTIKPGQRVWYDRSVPMARIKVHCKLDDREYYIKWMGEKDIKMWIEYEEADGDGVDYDLL